MKENIDLKKILKYCQKGTKLYSPLVGEVEFERILDDSAYSVITLYNNGRALSFTSEGLYYDNAGAECLLFPSKEQRDWSKFTAPRRKNKRFDPKTLKPFDKVLARDLDTDAGWICNFFSHYCNGGLYPCVCVGDAYSVCIPYNEETKHLVGTNEEAPEYYRYWDE